MKKNKRKSGVAFNVRESKRKNFYLFLFGIWEEINENFELK